MEIIGSFDPEEFDRLYAGPGDEECLRALAAIEATGGWKAPEKAIALGSGLGWRPDLVAGSKDALALSLEGAFPQALIRRMQVATDQGYKLTVALGSLRLELSILLTLQALDARIVAVDWFERAQPRVTRYRSVADWIASEGIALSPDDLRALAEARLEEALADPTNVKGRLYEEALCLVFSQVPWITVDEHAYRNESEEIDLVLGVHATGHIAELARGPVAIATAKNESKPTGSATVKYLKEQMANRKGLCKLGFLCSASTISDDAGKEILRGSQSSDVVLVQMDLHDLRHLLQEPSDLDVGVQDLIRRAIAE
ncbi:MAG: hypothetical protein JSU06_10030 [Actinobacteria bacterium]|nr:hypothetical protein [Actinomycetota bacterium]